MEKKEILKETLKDFFENLELRDEDTFDKDELDSFEKMNLLVLLEEVSEKELSIIELFECNTMGDIIAMCL